MPFLANQQHDEVLSDEGETQEAGETDEAGETKKLAEDGRHGPLGRGCLAFPQHWLCYALHHAADGGNGHIVPLAGIGIYACDVTAWIETIEKHSESIIVELEGETIDKELRRKAKHLPCRAEKSEK